MISRLRCSRLGGLRAYLAPLVLAALVVLFLCPLPVHAKSLKRLLVVTVTKGFRHDSIPLAEETLADLARESGRFTVDFARSDADLAEKMSLAGLKNYDGVVFANTTGELPLPDRQGFLDWVRAGHGFVGVHSATDTFHGFPAYREMVGAEFMTHDKQVSVSCLVDDRRFPATAMLGDVLLVPQEEIYQFKNFLPDQVHLLLHLEKHPTTGAPGLYPIAWSRDWGRGRVFYTALGHRTDIWTAPWFRQHLLGGVLWALHLAKGTGRPRPMPAIADVAFPAARP